MDYRTRRLEQRRQQRLGCFILTIAVAVAIVLASIIMALLPPLPVAATIAFYILAVLIAGAIERGLRRLLGYESRKASLQHLKSNSSAAPLFPSSTQLDLSPNSDSSVDAQLVDSPQISDHSTDSSESQNQTPDSSLVVKMCPNCNTRVVPKADRTCPACQKRVPESTK